MVDSRLRPARRLSAIFAQRERLQYFTTGDNYDYLADEVLLLEESETEAALRAGDALFELLRDTARRSLEDPRRRALLGVTEVQRPLLEWSVEHEWDDYYCGRFDFSGGIDDIPLHLIEFNADTCSLLPETLYIQPEVLRQADLRAAPNRLAEALRARAERLLAPDPEAPVLATHLGYEEDAVNLRALARPFERKGRTAPLLMELPHLIFDPEEGVLVELGPDDFLRYELLLKYFPWDFAAREEPELWELLEEMITTKKAKVLNPAWSMLLQSKALLAFAYEDHPLHPLLLPTVFRREDLPSAGAGYVTKPVFGRTGENISLFLDGRFVTADRGGDYGDQPVIYQEAAPFAMDVEHYRYQLSVFQAPQACAICCRRQDDFILDDDAEFVSVGMLRPY